ncbi:MAG: hypothetical protein HFJ22_05760 [Clostridia bacterium]|mgnify:CR=1 FL=1|jgi:hypothetical protein|nr:hypothetical protein [Clostridia bacterium]
MQKTVKGKVYDTEVMQIVKKVTVGSYGDPDGYEEILFKAEDGTTFLYANGGASSKHSGESLATLTKAKADAWVKDNA